MRLRLLGITAYGDALGAPWCEGYFVMKALLSKVSNLALLVLIIPSGCASGPPAEQVKSTGLFGKDYVIGRSAAVKQAIAECQQQADPKPQVVTGERFKLNVKICVVYTGDGTRPIDPWDPKDWEVSELEAGEVYFVAIIKDLAADTQKLTIQSDLIRDLIRSRNYLYNYDLYHGSPTDSLDVYIGVFDDAGWPSDRTEKIKTLQQSLGKTVELFPPAAPYIPFIQPILDFIPVAMDFFDPDDNLISGRVIVTKTKIQVNGKDQIQWRLENPVIHNDNGKIILTMTP